MSKLGNLYISLIADTASFSSGLNKAKSDTNSAAAAINAGLAKVDKSFTGLGHSIKDMLGEVFSLKGAFTSLVGVIGVGSIVELGRQAVESVGRLGELAAQLGITTDTLQTFSYAATQVGLSQDDLETGIRKLTKTIGEAAVGNKAAIDSFDKFGIKILDAQGNVRSTEAVIRDIANAMEALPDPAQRAALATELMGRAGQKLIPFLQDGAAGIDALTRKAKDLGLVFDESTIKSAEDASHKMATLSYVIKTELSGALVQLAPDLALVAEKMIAVSLAFDRGINRVAAFFGVINTHNLGTVNEEITKLYQKLNAEQAKVGKDGIFGYDQSIVQKNIEDYKNQLAELVKIRAQLMSGEYATEHPEVAGTPGAGPGVSNPKPRAAATSSRKTTTDAIKEQKSALDELIASMSQELALSKETDRQRAIDEAAIKANTAAQRDYDAGLRDSPLADQATIDRIKAMAAAQYDTAQAQKDSAAAAKDQGKAFQDASSATGDWSNAMTELGATFTSDFEDAVISGKSLSDVLDGLLQDLERIALRIAENQALQGLFGQGGVGSGGGLFGSLWDAISGGSGNAGPELIGKAASGGYIQVGEHGPEKFWPGVSGLITPNGMDGGRSGSGGGDLHIIINDNAGNQITTQRQTGPDGTKQLLITLEQKLAGSVRSGGPLRKAIGDTFGASGVAQVQRGG